MSRDPHLKIDFEPMTIQGLRARIGICEMMVESKVQTRKTKRLWRTALEEAEAELAKRLESDTS